MSRREILRCAIFLLGVAILPIQLWSAVCCAAETVRQTEELDISPALVREIQFMLLRLDMEPGPIDGVIGPRRPEPGANFSRAPVYRKWIW